MIRSIILALLIIIVSCKSTGNTNTDDNTDPSSVKPAASSINSFEGPAALLLKQLRDQGDYVNSRQFPSMIKPETVFAELDGNNLVIDLRDADGFISGHINKAVNVPMNEILSYFENEILPFQYEKIILVCSGGQRTSYATQLLRLMGYGNVYSMRWGMCGWNSDFTGYLWETKISSKYQDRLLSVNEPKPASVNQPPLQSSASTGDELLRERVSHLLSLSPKEIFISSEMVFNDLENYFIVNFERKDKYESGHIPGAIRYKQQGTLGIPSQMGTLPLDKPIVVYCGTGMTSAFAVAYLRMFGYDARSLSYGNNSFMHGKMMDDNEQLSWHPFTEDIPQELPYVKGNN
ncbi:rhodanese-like domain-containing protein [Bacteroidota bacterium]